MKPRRIRRKTEGAAKKGRSAPFFAHLRARLPALPFNQGSQKAWRMALVCLAALIVVGGLLALLRPPPVSESYRPVAAAPALVSAGPSGPNIPAALPPLPPSFLATAPAALPQPDTAPAPLAPPRPDSDAVPERAVADKPHIVLIIDDMGLDRKRSTRALQLPGPLVMAFLPYADDLQAQADRARARGHETIVHMPMQPQGRENPGPDALMVGLSEAEIRRRLDANLAAFSGFIGINNHMGSHFTADARGMDRVMQVLAARNLAFLDSRTTPKSQGRIMALRHGVPVAERDVFLDHDPRPAAVAAALRDLEAIARRKGVAIGIGHPHDVTLDALAAWLPGLAQRGYVLVPLSAVLSRPNPTAATTGITSGSSDGR
jgi:uncharacterized protein